MTIIPKYSILFMLFTLAALGLPGTSGFIGEFLILMGAFKDNFLVAVLAGLSGQYVLLAAEFVATTQVLVYIGAVMVLFLFGIMLTKAPIGKSMQMTGTQWPIAAGVSLMLGVVILYSLIDQFGSERVTEGGKIYRTADVGDEVFSTYIIPFEAISVLLLAALIGAIVLARKD